MKKTLLALTLVAIGAAGLSGCATPAGQQDGLVGGIGGAVVGAVLGGPRGAIVGATVGAVGGGLIGDQTTYAHGAPPPPPPQYAPPPVVYVAPPPPCHWHSVSVYRYGQYVGQRQICN